ncbi:enoyl-CoA hydratase/isomerase family protein [Gemmatimonadota bacterium]
MRVQVQGTGTPVRRIGLGPGEETEVLIDVQGVAALAAALEDAEKDPSCRVMVVEGTPGVFCSGMDLGFATSATEQELLDQVRGFARCLAMMRSSKRVVISVVDGEAVGGGVGLAAAADVCLATERSSFALPELVLGLVPAVVLPVLLHRVLPQKVRLMCFSAAIRPAEALAWGLVDRVVEGPGELEKAVRSAIKHCLRCSPRAVAELKAVSAGGGRDLPEALEAGAEHMVRWFLDDEATLRALEGFLDGEALPWFDRYRPEGTSR